MVELILIDLVELIYLYSFLEISTLKMTLLLVFDISYDKSETLMTSVLISDPSEFNQQELSTSLSLKPKVGYIYKLYYWRYLFNYILTENKTSGRREERFWF